MVEFTTPWRRLVDDFADELAGAAGRDGLGGILAEWLLDKDGVDDVFAEDAALSAVVIELARVVAEEPEPEPEPEPEDDDDDDLGGDFLRALLGARGGGSKTRRAGPRPSLSEALDVAIDEAQLDRDVWMAQWCRRSFTPVTREGDGPVGASKFGGAAFLLEGESWPVCPECGEPLQLFVQLDLAELPDEVDVPHREGLLQLFYGTSHAQGCPAAQDEWQPFAKGTYGRWLPAVVLGEKAQPAQDPIGKPVALLSGWNAQPAELAAYEEEIPEEPPEGLDEIEDEKYQPRGGDKVGGWPAWVQGPEYPKCPECKQPMAYIMQLDSNGLTHTQFGDMGTGHVFQCATHPKIVTFGWACH